MPKILIKEFDKTSPGTPDSYVNYSVLIAGYKGTASTEDGAMIVEPDSNGIYEFSSKQAFKDTIDVVDPEKTFTDESGAERTEHHYGNRMAYELLGLGYTVIYVPIDKIKDMDTEAFWEIFKDKASYDFRFISHGLLETNHDVAEYQLLEDRLAEIETDVDKLAEIAKAENPTEEYARIIEEGYEGFKYTDGTGKVVTYKDYASASEQLAPSSSGVIPAQKAQQDLLAAHDAVCVTSTVFNNINSHIAKLASYRTDEKGTPLCSGRGDCIALIELDDKTYTNNTSGNRPEKLIIDGIQRMAAGIGADGTYCAMTVPSVYYKMSEGAVKFPAAFHYLACFMNSLSAGFAEWYAAAGYTRGVANYAIDHTSVKLGEIAINALEPRQKSVDSQFACNVIANFRGSYYLWGNRTAEPLKDSDLVAHHFLNIRQLCTTIKKQLYVACRRFTFDPNSDTLWFNFVNAITPTLDIMKADQGIRDYKVLKVFTDKKATLKAKIRIIPIEAVEDFDLEISLEDSFGETSAVING